MSAPAVLVRVDALWRPGPDRAGLRAAAESLAGPVTRLCPRCAGTDHGRPRTAGGALSLAYAAGLVVLARAEGTGLRLGVDVEPDPGVGPTPAGLADRAAWTRAEAVLKATGEGLRRDPASVRADEAWTTALPLPPGWAGTLAVLPARPVQVRWREHR